MDYMDLDVRCSQKGHWTKSLSLRLKRGKITKYLVCNISFIHAEYWMLPNWLTMGSIAQNQHCHPATTQVV